MPNKIIMKEKAYLYRPTYTTFVKIPISFMKALTTKKNEDHPTLIKSKYEISLEIDELGKTIITIREP
jgi:hypothetical protein